MNIMTKRGTHDNVVTYEHICDSHTDLPNIPQDQIVLGSTAIVLNDNEEGFGVYMADSDKQWVRLMVGSGSGGSFNLSDAFHLCGVGEYGNDGVPTISNPSPDQIYFVPSGSSTTGDTFNEWIYVDDGWERFGGGTATIEGGQSDWEETSSSDVEFIKNKPAIQKGIADINANIGYQTAVVMNHLSQNEASGECSVAEGYKTTAAADNSHAEGTQTIANGQDSHVEGALTKTTIYAQAGHAEGYYTTANNMYSHAEGYGVAYFGENNNKITPAANGTADHVEGMNSRTLSNGAGGGNHAEGVRTTAGDDLSPVEGAHAEGSYTVAASSYAHAEGQNTKATGRSAHSEGETTYAGDTATHAEGIGGSYSATFPDPDNVTGSVIPSATGLAAHTEGYQTRTINTGGNKNAYGNHAEGYQTTAGQSDTSDIFGAHAEGKQTFATKSGSHAEGILTQALAEGAHAEGSSSKASGDYSHAEGHSTSSGTASHAEGSSSTASGYASHAEGYSSTASDNSSHAEGYTSTASGPYSHSEGFTTIASGNTSHSEGSQTQATGGYAHAEGYGVAYNGANNNSITCAAAGSAAHTEGYQTRTLSGGSPNLNLGCHAEGYQTTAGDTQNAIYGAHAEGSGTFATGIASHAEGVETTASGAYSHAEGNNTTASGLAAHAEGTLTTASAMYSHAGGFITNSNTNATTVIGINNAPNPHNATYNNIDNRLVGGWSNPSLDVGMTVDKVTHPALIVGNGIDAATGATTTRSNAMVLYLDGDVCFDGGVYVGGQRQDQSISLNVFFPRDSTSLLNTLNYYTVHTSEGEIDSIDYTPVPYLVYYSPTQQHLIYYDNNGDEQIVP